MFVFLFALAASAFDTKDTLKKAKGSFLYSYHTTKDSIYELAAKSFNKTKELFKKAEKSKEEQEQVKADEHKESKEEAITDPKTEASEKKDDTTASVNDSTTAEENKGAQDLETPAGDGQEPGATQGSQNEENNQNSSNNEPQKGENNENAPNSEL